MDSNPLPGPDVRCAVSLLPAPSLAAHGDNYRLRRPTQVLAARLQQLVMTRAQVPSQHAWAAYAPHSYQIPVGALVHPASCRAAFPALTGRPILYRCS